MIQWLSIIAASYSQEGITAVTLPTVYTQYYASARGYDPTDRSVISNDGTANRRMIYIRQDDLSTISLYIYPSGGVRHRFVLIGF